MYVGFCSNKDCILMGRECMDIKKIQQKVGTVSECFETPLSHCWRSALSEIRICLPETLETIFVWGNKTKDESVFDTRFEASVGFIKRSCRGAVRVGLKPIAASHFRLFLWNFISTGSQKTGKCASSTLTRLQQNWFPKVSGKQMQISDNAPTMRKRRFQTFPNNSHLLLNRLDLMHSRPFLAFLFVFAFLFRCCFFPTLSCGVFVFGAVSAVLLHPPPPPAFLL